MVNKSKFYLSGKVGHSLGLAIGNVDQIKDLIITFSFNMVNNVVTSSFELDNRRFGEIFDERISQGFSDEFTVGVDDSFKVHIFVNFVDGQQMIIFNQVNFNQVGLSEPVDLLGGLEVLIVFLQVGLQEKSIALGFNAGDDDVTPLHKGDLFSDLQSVGIFEFDVKFVGSVEGSGSQSSVLGVNGDIESLGFRSVGTVNQNKSTDLLGGDSSVSGSNGVNVLLIQSPELIPLLKIGVLGRALFEHEFNQSGDLKTSSQNTLFDNLTYFRDKNLTLTVGNLGSFQPSTLPVSTNHWSFLLDKQVLTKLSLENS